MTTDLRQSTRRWVASPAGECVTVLHRDASEDRVLADLVQRAADGNQEAWRAIVERYSALLWSVVRSHRLSDAQAADAVQATWLKLLENIRTIREPARLAGWLRTTVRRECLETLRRTGRERPSDPHSAEPVAAAASDLVDGDPEGSALRRERVDLVRAAVADMPERSQRLLELLVASPPLRYEEIGARLGMPVGSIGPTRARLLARLRATLAAADLCDAA
ncbi:RNA polymerase sigma factor, sigma-70 family [Geodermatophilus siccatus]|uniref:RNA polymerase sigma factor, sigma-70 family n=1 Tax=Geodermatophilus siccatus TaxID=1137991 RepID=A0A1G9YCG0_9ACTN|nr:sigma-70 family RNA polymerase sigma factor [Geodermatophilus siccatus]SDN06789.1 RNA polymerase sigma factor, sigma-70 family [Geodermatophilus siccatus]